jgi:UDP-N-acetylmuramoyl-tripeptide--D-alanyl-D-alanine ligase
MFLEKILQKILRFFAEITLKKYQPKIVVIVGSIGKTSTKEAIYSVLSGKFKTRRSIKNYNNEIGVPLTIINCESGEKSLFKWIGIFWKAILLNILKNKDYPEFLILEMAADKKGDIKYLMDIIPKKLLKVVVLTAITPVHLEFFESVDNIFEEKTTPFSYLEEDGLVVFNIDNCDAYKVKEEINSKLLTYGLNENADINAQEIEYYYSGLKFKINYKDQIVFSELKNAIADYQIYPILAGVGVGIYFSLKLDEIIKSLKTYKILSKRMEKFKGIKDSIVIDDTYNSSPEALKKAIQALDNLSFGQRKIAVLGDMLELGKDSEKLHREIGETMSKTNIDYLVTFGEKARYISDEALKNNFSKDKAFHFSEKDGIVEFIKKNVKENDVILIKGSRGMEMEKIVEKVIRKDI